MKNMQRCLDDLDARGSRVLGELHPQLRLLVGILLEQLDGRFVPYCGYRGPSEQAAALAMGTSEAAFGESPHNFKPALACDLVLSPRRVTVRGTTDPKTGEWPDLWDDVTLDAAAAWMLLEEKATSLGLERVNVRGRRDKPHVQLHGWRALIA